MPITQLIVKLFVFLVVNNFAQTLVAATNGLRYVANAALLNELGRDELVRMSQLLQLDDAAIIGVIIRSNWFCSWSDTTWNTQLAPLVSGRRGFLRLWIVVLFERVSGQRDGRVVDDVAESGE